ncbi:DUF1178 family protein [Noviherbaspirillum aridicola]|uniref:DUF1178 family protein n=1 Tax=Noviherbaspirillum aridicola TaxID=2849687 RepID=A0ABQ4Q2R3_9BURK|nr:DUF1178 family protein [Noviherbaspirillum aridicola]GIZ51140.1 hypothetical protein NCCP691_11540 [Noviherbaspirillum aridicola]
MKVYNLCCGQGHRFEGWFSSEEDSRAQLEQQSIACPVCDSRAIGRVPSAPRLNLSQGGAPVDPSAIQAKLMTLLRQAVARSEDVGERFAEEARRMHYEEAPGRAIRGTSTAEEFAELVEEGIDVLPLPAMLDPKQTLQ